MKHLGIVLFIAIAAFCYAQTPLNNDSIIKMAEAGLGEDVIISSINAQPGNYSTGVDDLIALKSAGASSKVITAMISKVSGPSSDGGGAKVGAGPVSEVGVYFKKSDTWADLPPEVVNFKTGGVIQNHRHPCRSIVVVTSTVTSIGSHSPTTVRLPVDLLVYTAEGVSVTEYQLLRLRDEKDAREFRTVTGGVLHVSGGQTRDIVPFENKKIAPRTA